ncbi:hypothetical protein ACU4GD_26935 [Cupriavidus basilensis]
MLAAAAAAFLSAARFSHTHKAGRGLAAAFPAAKRFSLLLLLGFRCCCCCWASPRGEVP